jgi:hypothetical protein
MWSTKFATSKSFRLSAKPWTKINSSHIISCRLFKDFFINKPTCHYGSEHKDAQTKVWGPLFISHDSRVNHLRSSCRWTLTSSHASAKVSIKRTTGSSMSFSTLMSWRSSMMTCPRVWDLTLITSQALWAYTQQCVLEGIERRLLLCGKESVSQTHSSWTSVQAIIARSCRSHSVSSQPTWG